MLRCICLQCCPNQNIMWHDGWVVQLLIQHIYNQPIDTYQIGFSNYPARSSTMYSQFLSNMLKFVSLNFQIENGLVWTNHMATTSNSTPSCYLHILLNNCPLSVWRNFGDEIIVQLLELWVGACMDDVCVNVHAILAHSVSNTAPIFPELLLKQHGRATQIVFAGQPVGNRCRDRVHDAGHENVWCVLCFTRWNKFSCDAHCPYQRHRRKEDAYNQTITGSCGLEKSSGLNNNQRTSWSTTCFVIWAKRVGFNGNQHKDAGIQ